MPIVKAMKYAGLPAFVICHGSPWKVNESMREDYSYIDWLTLKPETEPEECAGEIPEFRQSICKLLTGS